MFDIGLSEILLIAVVAIVAIGPEDMPEALFRFGRFIRQVKIFLSGLQNQYSEIMHEAELQHYRRELNTQVIEHKEEANDAKPLSHETE
jgi:sec-independent protein translocase protein TatB